MYDAGKTVAMASTRTWLAMAVSGLAVIGAATTGAALAPDGGSHQRAASVMATAAGDPVLVGAGDIASGGPEERATAALIASIPGTVFTLGDNAYPAGRRADFRHYYRPTWGAFLARTRPAPGNHDYLTPGARAYFTYFGSAAGPHRRGYYSYNLGAWHIVALNSEISMRTGSPQERWLERNLDASRKQCTLAYWHRPRFTSGAVHGPSKETNPLVRDLYRHGAEIVLAGHNHQYERFAPMTPKGYANPRGIRFFVVGTGGAEHYGFGKPKAHSQVRNGDTSGVLKLTLHAHSYHWEFVPIAGRTFTDSGTGTCH